MKSAEREEVQRRIKKMTTADIRLNLHRCIAALGSDPEGIREKAVELTNPDKARAALEMLRLMFGDELERRRPVYS